MSDSTFSSLEADGRENSGDRPDFLKVMKKNYIVFIRIFISKKKRGNLRRFLLDVYSRDLPDLKI